VGSVYQARECTAIRGYDVPSAFGFVDPIIDATKHTNLQVDWRDMELIGEVE